MEEFRCQVFKNGGYSQHRCGNLDVELGTVRIIRIIRRWPIRCIMCIQTVSYFQFEGLRHTFLQVSMT